MVKVKGKIRFHLLYKFQLQKRRFLKNFILQLFELEGKEVQEIDFIFCTDEYLLNINRQYLNHDSYTDIITFPLHYEAQPIHSNIFISVDRVQENSQNLKIRFKEELYRVIIHGALHLCGYRDKAKEEIKQMRAAEDKYLNMLVSRETQP